MAMVVTDNGVATTSTTSRWLKREDCRYTEHDSAFSDWKLLIGPSDWEDHAQGREGAEKYRFKNLPNCTSCTGVYELGIFISRNKSGRETSKLDPDFIIPVYLGKAAYNVRSRLQQYGRDGAHLENGGSDCKLNNYDNVLAQKGPGLFSEIFAKGCSIVYRWVPMKDSREAEKTEAKLLDTFDYAWNKGSNGYRRQNDILKRIDCTSRTSQFLQKFRLFPQRRKGIKIKPCKPPLLEDGYNIYTNFPPNDFFARVLKFGRTQPILVPWRSGVDEYCPSICGVALGHGVVCRKSPSEGRKRCAEHKGMKINGTSSKLLAGGRFTLAADKHPFEKDVTPVCGVTLGNGSSCTKEPVQGHKRCQEHKGRKVLDSIPQSVQVKKEYLYGPILDHGNNQNILRRKAGGLNPFSSEQVVYKNGNTICGMDLKDGTFCTRQPPAGRKRCEEHKGMRLKEASSRSFTGEVPCVFDCSGAKSYAKEEKKNCTFLPSLFSGKSSATCAMTLHDGGNCSRKPLEGNKRCWQHKGMRLDKNCTFLPSIVDDKSFSTCGAPLHNGSFCSRNPTEGNKRCWQHQGMRINASSGSSICYKSANHYTASGYSSYGSATCGAPLRNGSYCRRRSSGRCWQHGG